MSDYWPLWTQRTPIQYQLIMHYDVPEPQGIWWNSWTLFTTFVSKLPSSDATLSPSATWQRGDMPSQPSALVPNDWSTERTWTSLETPNFASSIMIWQPYYPDYICLSLPLTLWGRRSFFVSILFGPSGALPALKKNSHYSFSAGRHYPKVLLHIFIGGLAPQILSSCKSFVTVFITIGVPPNTEVILWQT